MLVLTSEQMKKTESNAVQLGLSWLRLMENAGAAAAKAIRNSYDLKDRKIVILCGKGNNGGDGYVIARKLHENSIKSRVISVGTPSTPSAKEMYSKAVGLGLKPLDFESYEDLCRKYITEADIIIDALFGTGFKGEPIGIFQSVINSVKMSSAAVISIDIPSGIESDRGEISGCYITADTTVTFAAYKPCHLLYPSNEYCGNVAVVSIGIPDTAYYGIAPYARTVTDDAAFKLLPKRGLNHHKGLSGTAGLYVGSLGMAGAAVIAAKGAVKSGAGIVNVIVPSTIYPIIASAVPEAVCTVLDNTKATEESDNLSSIISTLNCSASALAGCGLGVSDVTAKNIRAILKSCNVPLVLDADGINIAASCIDILREYKNEKILTPHPKEAARIMGCPVDDVLKNRAQSALIIANYTKSVTILKGAHSCIATPDGELFFITDGNPGMATAGTGDMLAGMAAAFLAQGLSAKNSAILAAKLHALSGDRALKVSSLLSLTPTDMLEELPKVISNLYHLR